MERVQKEQGRRDSANAPRVSQGRFAQIPVETDIASRIHNSPMMVAQAKQLQGMFGGATQLQVEKEETLQGRFVTAQRTEEEEEPLQGKFAAAVTAQLEQQSAAKPNNTGLPDNLKTGVESLSGISMDSVKVHYNSPQPAQLNALACAQGSDIHVAPGQEQHLPHEAWHVVQQAQGRVQPTMQTRDGVPVNDDVGLENEADVMGGRAAVQMQAYDVNFAPVGSSRFSFIDSVQLASASYGETTVDWSEGSLGGDTVGMKMTAKKLKKSSIGKHTNLKGSPPAANQQATLMSFLPTNPKLPKPDKFIKGHLLNHNIGGPGKDFNMFPITASANGTHLSAVETDVKSWVLSGNTVDYEVAVNCSGSDLKKGKKAGWVTASFDCTAKNHDTAATIAKSIPSVLGDKSVSEKISVLDGIGSLGIFAAVYDWAVELDDPTKMIWTVAEAVAKKKGVDKDPIAEVLMSVVLFDDVRDISEDAGKAVSPILNYMKSTCDWKKELGI